MKRKSWLTPAAGIVLILAVSFACLPQPQRQYLQQDAARPALEWLTARAQLLEGHLLQKFPALGAADSRLRAQFAQARPALQRMLDSAAELIHQASSRGSSNGVNESRQQVADPACRADEVAACRMSGQVAHCGCDYASVERLNQDHLFPLLTELVELPFFRYFKVNLYCDCPFWPEEGMCFQQDCCVTECEQNEIPETWREQDKMIQEHKGQLCEGESQVDRRVDPAVKSQLTSIKGWHGLNNPWVPGDDEGVEYVYVDLRRNPEKYTGYKGEDARRVWAAIYDQSALKEAAAAVRSRAQPVSVPREKEILFRLISGMHTAITTSIVNNFYHEDTGTWGQNLQMFKARFGMPEAKAYVENLYFTLLFVLRAATKAGPNLATFGYNTGQPAADARTEQLVKDLVSSEALKKACPTPFDEGLLWRSEGSEALATELQSAFHNITRVMDCVGCEKCKMHGKLNILGIASAMKVLFSMPPSQPGTSNTACADPYLVLDRNEVIAMLNLLAKLSKSVEALREMSLKTV